MRELHLFAGAGGGILGGMLLGHTTVCAVEIEPYRRKVLLQRQRDGILPRFPIWDDITTFDARPWRNRVDVVCGGFPCQDISAANPNAQGIEGQRSGLWKHQCRVISEIRPPYALVENSPLLVGRGLAVVLGDLAEIGYNARWGVFSCRDAGGFHLRERMFILASNCWEKRIQGRFVKAILGQYRFPWGENGGRREDIKRRSDLPETVLLRSCNDVAHYVDRIAAIGDGQVPAVVELAWETLQGY